VASERPPLRCVALSTSKRPWSYSAGRRFFLPPRGGQRCHSSRQRRARPALASRATPPTTRAPSRGCHRAPRPRDRRVGARRRKRDARRISRAPPTSKSII
jgi:hypothetical protein